MSCQLCDCENQRVLSTKTVERYDQTFTLYQCSGCKLCYVEPISFEVVQKSFNKIGDPSPTEKELKRFQKKIRRYQSPLSKRILRELKNYPYLQKNSNPFFKILCLFLKPFVFKNIIPFRGDGRILDIGCSNGLTLDIYQHLGWDAYGIEPRKPFYEVAKNRGLKIFNGILEESKYEEKFFDVVRLNQVFEHLRNPVEILRKIKSLLKDNGVLYIEVPNQKSFCFHFFKEKFYGYPGHLFIYSPLTMALMCKKAGLRVRKVKIRSSRGFFLYSLKQDFQKSQEGMRGFLAPFIPWRLVSFLFIKPFCFVLELFSFGDIFEVEVSK